MAIIQFEKFRKFGSKYQEYIDELHDSICTGISKSQSGYVPHYGTYNLALNIFFTFLKSLEEEGIKIEDLYGWEVMALENVDRFSDWDYPYTGEWK